MSTAERSLTLAKGQHVFAFRYAEGREAALLAALVDLANDPDSEFDWFDAAVLSYQMGQQLTGELSTNVQVEKARDVQHSNAKRHSTSHDLRRK